MENTTPIDIEKFLALAMDYPICDVRTPDEFAEGHIPGAKNLPLFSNEERTKIGTTYKQTGSREAILQGLDFVGPKMRSLIESAEKISPERIILLHCWRGGMRSRSVAWLLGVAGFKVYLLQGGYKAFRQYARSLFEKEWRIHILSGYTGSGKTAILEALSHSGEQIIDLEKLAHHKGSSFGALGEAAQPSQQQFENELALALRQQKAQKPLWLEDESRKIGCRVIPKSLWEQMCVGKVFFLNMPLALRVQRLQKDYGSFPKEDLKSCVVRLKKRLGGLHTKQAVDALEKNDISVCTALLLKHYYDKTYLHGLSKRNPETIIKIDTTYVAATYNADLIQERATHLAKR